MKIQDFARDKVFLVICFTTVILDLLYPITFTYDSGQYFSYFKILSGELSMANWDPVRGVVFPLYLYTITDLFGKSVNSLLIPVVLFHLLLFVITSYFVLSTLNNSYTISKRTQRLIFLLVFALVVIDPLIIGIYHAVLTEYIASTIALLSCTISYFLYTSVIQSKRIRVIYFINFSILVIIAWHLKQPYFGAALFPLFLISIFIILKQKKRKESVQIILGNLLVIIMLIVSIFSWDLILPNTGLASDQDRSTSGFIAKLYSQNIDLIKKSPIVFIKNFIKNYLAISNIFYFNQENNQIDKTFSITRANENRTIGYRIYQYGESNMALPAGFPEKFMENIRYYSSNYYPPLFINRILQLSTIKSSILFSSLYLLLPFIFISFSILLILSKNISNWMVVIYVCGGSSFLNAIEHSLINNPVDRYLFWGYPLLLICFLLIILYFIKSTVSIVNKKYNFVK